MLPLPAPQSSNIMQSLMGMQQLNYAQNQNTAQNITNQFLPQDLQSKINMQNANAQATSPQYGIGDLYQQWKTTDDPVMKTMLEHMINRAVAMGGVGGAAQGNGMMGMMGMNGTDPFSDGGFTQALHSAITQNPTQNTTPATNTTQPDVPRGNNFVQSGSPTTSYGVLQSDQNPQSAQGMPQTPSIVGKSFNPQTLGPLKGSQMNLIGSDGNTTVVTAPTEKTLTTIQNRTAADQELGSIGPQVTEGLAPYNGLGGSASLVADALMARLGDPGAQQRQQAYANALKLEGAYAGNSARLEGFTDLGEGVLDNTSKELFGSAPYSIFNNVLSAKANTNALLNQQRTLSNASNVASQTEAKGSPVSVPTNQLPSTGGNPAIQTQSQGQPQQAPQTVVMPAFKNAKEFSAWYQSQPDNVRRIVGQKYGFNGYK